MQQQKLGKRRLVVLAFLLSLSACRNSKPPQIEICILDGVGGGDCIEADGSKKYRPPSEMLNYWSTNQPDMANFSSWCYDAPAPHVAAQMEALKSEARSP
jgi:hypothetical protein